MNKKKFIAPATERQQQYVKDIMRAKGWSLNHPVAQKILSSFDEAHKFIKKNKFN